MKSLLFAALLFVVLVSFGAEPLVTSDSLQSDSLIFAADSTDSLLTVQSGNIAQTLLIPVAIIAATAGIFILLFTTRSK